MTRLAIYAAAGAGVLALISASGLQTWRLGNAQEALGEAKERVNLCRDANAQNQTVIEGLRSRLDEVVRQREAALADARAAVSEAERARERVESELSEAQNRLESLYEGDCAAWADLSVCPAVSRELRRD